MAICLPICLSLIVLLHWHVRRAYLHHTIVLKQQLRQNVTRHVELVELKQQLGSVDPEFIGRQVIGVNPRRYAFGILRRRLFLLWIESVGTVGRTNGGKGGGGQQAAKRTARGSIEWVEFTTSEGKYKVGNDIHEVEML